MISLPDLARVPTRMAFRLLTNFGDTRILAGDVAPEIIVTVRGEGYGLATEREDCKSLPQSSSQSCCTTATESS